jgi:hypothetical protein
MTGSLMYEDLEQIIPGRATGYDRDEDGGFRITHNYNFDVAGDGQLYTTVEDLLRWDVYLHGAEKPAIYEAMLTEGFLNNGEGVGYAQGIVLGEYRGLHTVGHSGSSWGFRSQLLRFVEPGLSIAISCNSDFARPGEMAQRVADHYLADQLGSENNEEDSDEQEPDDIVPVEPPSLSPAELAEFGGSYFSTELDAIYRLWAADGSLMLRIEQETPLVVAPVSHGQFEFGLHPQGWSEPSPVKLHFRRDPSGSVTGFQLDSGDEQGIVFEKLQETVDG